ncbi:transposase [Nonomuraea sp. NPDC049758]|uniref:transposase n=1 Tax=Nonomuraea sp. NPDC049758 TaxID=3154360 RepID=UPI0034342D56
METAAQLLVTCADNPDRLRSEGSFAAPCGVSPVPASSGKTRRHRLNHAGDRQANRAFTSSCCRACPAIHPPVPTWSAEPPTGCPRDRSPAV